MLHPWRINHHHTLHRIADQSLLTQVRTDARKEACEKVLNTPDRILVGESAEWMMSEEKQVWVLFLKFKTFLEPRFHDIPFTSVSGHRRSFATFDSGC